MSFIAGRGFRCTPAERGSPAHRLVVERVRRSTLPCTARSVRRRLDQLLKPGRSSHLLRPRRRGASRAAPRRPAARLRLRQHAGAPICPRARRTPPPRPQEVVNASTGLRRPCGAGADGAEEAVAGPSVSSRVVTASRRDEGGEFGVHWEWAAAERLATQCGDTRMPTMLSRPRGCRAPARAGDRPRRRRACAFRRRGPKSAKLGARRRQDRRLDLVAGRPMCFARTAVWKPRRKHVVQTRSQCSGYHCRL